MTNQENPAAAETPGQVSGIVLGTTQRVLSVYDQVKDYSPMLKSSLEVVEARVPEEWSGKIQAASAPVLDGLDNRIANLSTTVTKTVADVNAAVTTSVIDPVSDKLVEVRAAVTTRVIEPVTTRVIEPVSNAYTKTVTDVNNNYVAPARSAVTTRVIQPATQTYNTVSETCTKTVADANDKLVEVRAAVTTRVIEPVSQTYTQTVADVKAVQWKDLRGDLTKKAIVRLEQGFVDVKEFSATRGKDMIHFDLIEYSQGVLDNGVAYSQSVVDNAATAAAPLLVPVTERVVAAVAAVRTAATNLQAVLAVKSAQTTEELSALREKVVQHIQDANEAARELSKQAQELVQTKYGELSNQVQARIPARQEMENRVLAIDPSGNVLAAVKVIYDSPKLFAEVRAKAELGGEKRVLENAVALLQAVREVVFAPVVEKAIE